LNSGLFAKLTTWKGGADGFGAAIVDRFSQEGCKVIFVDLNREKGRVKAESDDHLHYIYGNVSQRETWVEVLAFAKEKYGRVDVVVNNAGEICLSTASGKARCSRLQPQA
jgi:NAD(P)-dependent dehydrogenase (short-subunit alcohol dehydrogenase family)